MSLLVFAWRNLWRNSRRTMITLAAVGLNTAVLIASFALMDGLMNNALSNATNLVVGEAQLHNPAYLARRSFYESLDTPDEILARLDRQGLSASARSYGYGLVAHQTKSAGALFWGIDPARERTAFDLSGHLATGRFLTSAAARELVLGRKLARSLNVHEGDELVVVVQAADGSLGNELYTVAGVLKSAGDAIDRNAVIMHRDDFAELFVSDGRVHEIALNSRGALPLEQLTAEAGLAAPEAEVKTWRQLLPALSDMVNIFDVSIAIFGLIFFLAAGLGVMNTMLMATFERTREFGIIKALGGTPWRIVRDVAAEALVLGVFASLAGVILGVAVAWYLQEFGLDTTSLAGQYTVVGVAFDPVWRAVLSIKAVVWPVLGMWLVSLLAALYPAWLAARLNPVKAIHQA